MVDPQEWLAHAPKVSDALKKDMFVSITTWSGPEIAGVICDREQTGLLLDVHEPDVDSEGFVFLPWSSIEQVKIRARVVDDARADAVSRFDGSALIGGDSRR